MIKILSVFFVMGFAFGMDDSFITKEEYAKMLYENPRGIGCNRCHGVKGEGSIIARYKDKGKEIVLKAPNIKNISFKKFYKALTSKKHKFMPYYFLTDKEIKLLYYYLKEQK